MVKDALQFFDKRPGRRFLSLQTRLLGSPIPLAVRSHEENPLFTSIVANVRGEIGAGGWLVSYTYVILCPPLSSRR